VTGDSDSLTPVSSPWNHERGWKLRERESGNRIWVVF
jgi:hypothetical protein